MKRNKAIVLILIVALALLVWGCSSKSYPEQESQEVSNNAPDKKIFTTFYPMYFLTQAIVGDKAEVVKLIPAGAEPHDWEPTPKTMIDIQKGQMLVYNGAGMETWIDKVLASLTKSDVMLVCASDGLELIKADEDMDHANTDQKDNKHDHKHGHKHDHKHDHDDEEEDEHEEDDDHDHEHGEYDPHIWVSPARAAKQAQNIYNAIVGMDPENKDYYEKNLNSLLDELNKLDHAIKEASKSFKSNVIVVSHKAFGYLAKDYGLKQIAIRGVNPEEEPSPAQMARLVKECKAHKVKYIFFEKLVSPKLSETLAREVGAKTLVLSDVAALTPDEVREGKDYITIMYENIENLKKALSE